MNRWALQYQDVKNVHNTTYKILIVNCRDLHQCTFDMFLKIITLYLRLFFKFRAKNVTYLKVKSNFGSKSFVH